MSSTTIINRGETINCANPKLCLFTSVGGVQVAVSTLEFAIFDMANDQSPVQTFPVGGGFQTLDPLNDCPIGHRLAVGEYTAAWAVPDDEPLTPHKITWQFAQPGGPTAVYEQLFSVTMLAGSSQSLAEVSGFRARYTQFASSDAYTDIAIQDALLFAGSVASESLFGPTLYPRARELYAAHLLAVTADGSRASGATSLTTDGVSVVYGSDPIASSTNSSWLRRTQYGTMYLALARMAGVGTRSVFA